MFFWKILNGALPTAATLHKRIPDIPPHCKLCQAIVEDATHAIFHCPHARISWFISILGLKTITLENRNNGEILESLWNDLDKEQINYFMTLAWQIWKTRCDQVFQGQNCEPAKTVRHASYVMRGTHYQVLQQDHINEETELSRTAEDCTNKGYRVWMDGSIDHTAKGGVAHLLFLEDQLIRYEVKSFKKGVSPFHMETVSLLIAAKQVLERQIDKCQFFTDSKLLVDTLDPQRKLLPLQSADWRSHAELVQIVRIFRANPFYCCKYINREENTKAHRLANWARKEQVDYVGFTFPFFSAR